MTLSLRRDGPALTILALAFAAAAYAYPRAPERIPTHWGLDGQPDAWGGPASLFLVPAMAAGIWLLMGVLPRLDPGRANYPSFAGVYAVLRTGLVAFLGLLHGVMVASALGLPVDMGRVGAPATGLLFILIGGVLGKVRPNWFVGVRTPWTLTSKLSWTRTHRLAGWLFVGTGVLVLLASLISPAAGFLVMVVGAIGSTLLSLVYSHHVWARDPDRQSPGGTTPA